VDKAKSQCGFRVSDQEEEAKKAATQYMQSKVAQDFSRDSLIEMFGQEVINDLKSSSQKKKQKAIVEVKQIFSKKAVNINKERAKRLFEPISFLMRLVLSD
jgi:flagellin-specific chaperone FliS